MAGKVLKMNNMSKINNSAKMNKSAKNPATTYTHNRYMPFKTQKLYQCSQTQRLYFGGFRFGKIVGGSFLNFKWLMVV